MSLLYVPVNSLLEFYASKNCIAALLVHMKVPKSLQLEDLAT
jgi:hypothetical protein